MPAGSNITRCDPLISSPECAPSLLRLLSTVNSVIEAGLYVTAGTKLTLIDSSGEKELKAIELSGVPNLLFRRNSLTGRVEALSRSGAGVVLNKDLHP